MLIKEQKYKNKNRLYFHGKIYGFDETKSLYEEFYLTTRKEYAFKYAKRNGIIEIYCLKEEANIFNMKCASDEDVFRKYCQENSLSTSIIDVMKENDWSSVVIGGDSKKEELKNIIKKLNYDGFFNYEIDKEGLDFLHSLGHYRFTKSNIKSPSVAIFNKDILQKLDEKKIEDCVDKKEEEEFIKNEYFTSLITHPDFDKDLFIKRMYEATFSLNENDIVNIINNFTKLEIEKNLKNKIAYREALLRRVNEV